MSTLFKNSVFLGASKLAARLLGLISTFIVARILTPDDYAVIATCMLVQDLALRIENIGFGKNIISIDKLTPHFIGSVYLLRFLLGLVLFISVYSISGAAAEFFNNEHVEHVLELISFLFILQPLTNINILIEIRNNNFIPSIKQQIYSKVISVIATIALAIYLENYWALAIGMLIAGLSSTIISYLVTTPTLPLQSSKKEFPHIIGFSQWFFFQQLIEYLNTKVNQLLVAKIFEDKILGYYSLGGQVSFLYANEICNAIDNANTSELAEKKRTSNNFLALLHQNLSTILSAKTLLLVPVYFSFIFYPELVIKILLGDNWLEMKEFFRYFSITFLLFGYSYSFQSYIIVYRLPKLMFVTSIFALFLKFIVIVIAYYYKDPLMLAMGGVVIQLFLLITLFYIFIYITKSPTFKIAQMLLGELYILSGLALLFGLPLFIAIPSILQLALSLLLTLSYFVFLVIIFPNLQASLLIKKAYETTTNFIKSRKFNL